MTRSYTVHIESAPLAEKVTLDALDAYASALFANRRIAGPAPSANLATNTLGLSTSIDATSPDHAFTTVGMSFFDAVKRAGLGQPEMAEVTVEIDRADEVDRHELVSGGEVARRLGVSRERVRQLTENPARFPAPLATIGRDRVWRWVDIVDWAASRKRRLTKGPTAKKAAKRITTRR